MSLTATPGAAELSDTAMSPSDIVQRRFSRASPYGAQSTGWSSVQATEQGSLVSSTSFPRNIPPAPPSSESYATSSVAGGGLPPASTAVRRQQPYRQDSDLLPTHLATSHDAKELPATPPGADGPPSVSSFSQDSNARGHAGSPAPEANTSASTLPRGESGVSAFSERERSHLRNLSDPATVSTMDAVIGPSSSVRSTSAARPHAAGGGVARVGSPPILEEGAVEAANAAAEASSDVVSPPTGDEVEGEDYVAARAARAGNVSPVNVRSGPLAATPAVSSARKSAFRESDEDLGGTSRQ